MGSFSVFPALAGVILSSTIIYLVCISFSRTRGGDPSYKEEVSKDRRVFPALAGVILTLTRKPPLR